MSVICELLITLKPYFGHFFETTYQGKWQPERDSIEGVKEAREFRDVCLQAKLYLISAQHRPALA
jgi:hypothetical protein